VLGVLGNACDDGSESVIAQDERIRLSFEGRMFRREERKRMLVELHKWRERQLQLLLLLASRAGGEVILTSAFIMTRKRHPNNDVWSSTRGESAKHIMSRDINVAQNTAVPPCAGKECWRSQWRHNCCAMTLFVKQTSFLCLWLPHFISLHLILTQLSAVCSRG
jgi:hypothetical protein